MRLSTHNKNNKNKKAPTGIFFCVTIATESVPRTPTEVAPPWFTAFIAYSKKELTMSVFSKER